MIVSLPLARAIRAARIAQSSRRLPALAPTTLRPANSLVGHTIDQCPECAAPVTHASSCVSCPACGWGRCG